MSNPNNVYQGRYQLLKTMAGEWLARACHVATKLEVADFLDSGPKTIQELAQHTKTHEESLYRLLRVLTSVGIFEENNNKTFSHNTASVLLSSKHPDSLIHIIRFYAEVVPTAWDYLLPSVKEGIPAIKLATGYSQFEYGKVHPEKGDLFQKAMKEKSKAVAQSSIDVYDFGRYKTICDLGGGYGHYMLALLASYPQMHGIVFDLPEVIEAIKAKQGERIHARCKLIAGDFFKEIPKPVDAFLMKSVLHDWGDEDSVRILKKCYDSLNDDGRVLLIEVVLDDKQNYFTYCMDLLMLTLTGGKERSREEWQTLLSRGGFQLTGIFHTKTEFSVIEARKMETGVRSQE